MSAAKRKRSKRKLKREQSIVCPFLLHPETGAYLLVVRVGQACREHARRLMQAPANKDVILEVHSGRYADGSTTWEFLISSRSTPQRIQDVLWQGGLSWVEVRGMTEAEYEEAV